MNKQVYPARQPVFDHSSFIITVPKAFAERVCKGFAELGMQFLMIMFEQYRAMTLGVRGVTLMFSSGDAGVGDNNPDPATQQCFTNDDRNITRFIPTFPSSCAIPPVVVLSGLT